MKQNMPDTHGEVDLGPKPGGWPQIPAEPAPVREAIRQGRDRPRLLSPEERRLAKRNRIDARETAAQFEQWAVTECGAMPQGNKRIPSYSEFIPEA